MNLIQKKYFNYEMWDVLEEYTDSEHPLTIRELYNIVKIRGIYDVDYATVKRTLQELSSYFDEVNLTDMERRRPSGKKTIKHGYYIDHRFEPVELRTMIDALILNKNASGSILDSIIAKIEALSSKYFRTNISHIKRTDVKARSCNNLFYALEILNEAIAQNKKVSFYYYEYHTDKKMYPRRRSSGEPRLYKINPYCIAPATQRYYLICNFDGYEGYSYYRVDRIADIKILDEPVRPVNEIKGLENGLNLPAHLAEHIYMFTGESRLVEMKVNRKILNDLFDWFEDFTITELDDTYIIIKVKVNVNAVKLWAMQYGAYVEILSPDFIRNDIKKLLEEMTERYS